MSFTEEIQALAPVSAEPELRNAVMEHVYGGINAAFDRFAKYCQPDMFELAKGQVHERQKLKLRGVDNETVHLRRSADAEEWPRGHQAQVCTADKVSRVFGIGSNGACTVMLFPRFPKTPQMGPEVVAAQRLLAARDFWNTPVDDLAGMFDDLSKPELSDATKDMMAYFTYQTDKFESAYRHNEYDRALKKGNERVPCIRHIEALGKLISTSLPFSG